MQAIDRWTPLRELDQMERRMRRVFGELGLAPGLAPAADVYETPQELVVELEVPGFDEEQLEIEVADRVLTVKGTREEETEKHGTSLRIHERLERHFERSFALPPEIDPEHVEARYAKGVLTVHVPKTDTPATRRIAIGRP